MGYLLNGGIPYTQTSTVITMDRNYLYFAASTNYGCATEKGIDNIYYKAEQEGLLEDLRLTNDCIVNAIRLS
jgi:hypothetical protein